MRLVHISDTHLGFSAYTKMDQDEGINLREADVYRAFERAIDKTIELKPDLVIHSGDLFDTVRPQNRAIDLALRQLIRLSEAGIECVLISGNHSTPRLRETGNIFRIFEHLKHIHPVHEPGIARVAIGDIMVHAIPHSANPSINELLAKANPEPSARFNVLVIHAGIMGSDTYKMDEFNEQNVSKTALDGGWDYIALGHFHRFDKVTDRAYYAGSTERMGFGEAGQKKGVVEVDLERHSVKFHEIEVRSMLDLPPLDATGKESSEILWAARDLLSRAHIDDRIVRMVVSNVSQEAYRSLDVHSIKRLASSAAHFELRIDRVDQEGPRGSGDTQIGLLGDEFRKYIASLDYTDAKKSKLVELGMPYLEDAEE